MQAIILVCLSEILLFWFTRHSQQDTVVANSGAVGMVGMMLGGGFSPFTGLHGLAIDHIQSVEMITASGRIIDLSLSSSGDEGALFHILAGGGHGLGVITNMSLRVFPISQLRLDDGN